MSLLRHPSFREGARAGVPFAIASFILAATFGVLAAPVMGAVAAIVMSIIVYAGSAQFGALAVLAAGGGPVAAVVAGVLLNARYLPMGIALGPSIEGSALKRFLVGQGMIDFSWAAAARGDGRFDWRFMLGGTSPAYPMWVLGTIVGALAGDLIGDPERLGLDAIFPAFFLALLLSGEVSAGRRAVVAALLGGSVALALIPVAPAGLPVIAACVGALVGLDSAGRRGAAGEPEPGRAGGRRVRERRLDHDPPPLRDHDRDPRRWTRRDGRSRARPANGSRSSSSWPRRCSPR